MTRTEIIADQLCEVIQAVRRRGGSEQDVKAVLTRIAAEQPQHVLKAVVSQLELDLITKRRPA